MFVFLLALSTAYELRDTVLTLGLLPIPYNRFDNAAAATVSIALRSQS